MSAPSVMSAPPALPPQASLTVYTDPSTGMRIALAVGRPGRSGAAVAWRRMPGGLDEAVEGALRGARRCPAFAVVLPGRAAEADPRGALARCLERVELEGLRVGLELPAEAAGAVAA